jgi:hypothetical protein
MPAPASLHSRNKITFAGNAGRRWFLPIFVGLLSTNLVGLIPGVASDTPLTPIAAITKSLMNHDVTVQATVASIREPGSPGTPYIVTLTESSASIPLVYWPNMQPQLAPKLKTGNVIRANVTVGAYQDRLQLRIKSADAITLVSAAHDATTNATAAAAKPEAAASPAPSAGVPTAPPAETTVIGKIKGDWADRVVTILGTISGFEAADKGRRLSVQDATGEIAVVLGEKVLSGLVVTNLQPGWVLTVTGPVKLVDGKLALIPDTASAIKFVPQ